MPMTIKPPYSTWGPVIIWAALIFTLSAQPTLPSATQFAFDFIFKKSAHIFVYAVLYFLIARALGKPTLKHLSLAFLLCFIYAVSDEFHQSFVPGRSPRITDLGFDSIGAGIVFLKLRTHL